MKRFLPILILLILLATSCKSSKNKSRPKSKSSRTTTKTIIKKPQPVQTETETSNAPISKAVNAIIKEAKSYKGTKYKYGGLTKKGIDCSGLIHNAFGKNGVVMPRTTRELSVKGTWIDIKEVEKGDLVFFATRKNSRNVNHVGIVTSVNGDEFQFIHSTTSRGVIESKISERYWYLSYVQARRFL